MYEGEHRITNIEERTRKVEDAIIKFEYIADTILVQVENRLVALEKHDEELQAVLYSTCEIKSKEIDDKVGVAAKALRESFEQYFRWCVGISSGMFLLFVGYVAYDQGQKTVIHDAITVRALDSKENKTRIDSLADGMAKIVTKLDHISDTQYLLLDKDK